LARISTFSNPEQQMLDGFDEIDMSEADHVAWVRAQSDPALWHQAAMAALAYRGDDHGFLHWLLEQPTMDRSTAGWLFLWPEGSRYLRGEADFPLNHISSEKMVELFRALCARSERLGFTRDEIGLDQDFEPERKACLAIVARSQVAPGIIVPRQIIDRPFQPPKPSHFMLDDGIILA
jgi:hypothetical protein